MAKPAPIATISERLAPIVTKLRAIGHVRSVEVDEHDDRVDVVIRLRVALPDAER